MKENTLMKISLFGTLICVIALYFVSSQVVSQSVNIGDIDKSFVGKTVNITGIITGVFNNKNGVIVDMNDGSGNIKAVIWNDEFETANTVGLTENKFSNGAKINVIGNIQIYKGELEIIPVRGSVQIYE